MIGMKIILFSIFLVFWANFIEKIINLNLPIDFSKKLVLSNIKILGLPPSWEGKISDMIEQNKIYWEPWVQTANSFDDLRLNLKARGYSNIPANGYPMILVTPQVIVNINNFPKQKNMVQRGTVQ